MADERKPTGTKPGADAQRPERPTPPGGPSGMDLNPKPEPTRRVSKRGGMIIMGVLLVIVTLIVYGIFTRGKGPLAKEPQSKAKRLGAATATGDQVADNLLKLSKNRRGDDSDSDNTDDLKAPPLSSRVKPGSNGPQRQQAATQVCCRQLSRRENRPTKKRKRPVMPLWASMAPLIAAASPWAALRALLSRSWMP